MVRTQIQLSPRQYEELKKRARAKRISLAEIIRRMVDRGLALEPGEGAVGLLGLLATCGQFRESDRSYVAREHDSYLAETYQ